MIFLKPKKATIIRHLTIQYIDATSVRDLCTLGIDAQSDLIHDDTSKQIIRLLVTNHVKDTLYLKTLSYNNFHKFCYSGYECSLLTGPKDEKMVGIVNSRSNYDLCLPPQSFDTVYITIGKKKDRCLMKMNFSYCFYKLDDMGLQEGFSFETPYFQ